MERRDLVNSWLKEIGQELGVPDFEFNEDGVCPIQLREDMLLVLEVPEDGEVIYFYCNLYQVPEDQEEAIGAVFSALQMNLFMDQTAGGALAIAEEVEHIMYCYNLPIEGCDAQKLMDAIDTFSATAFELREKLEVSKSGEKPGELPDEKDMIKA